MENTIRAIAQKDRLLAFDVIALIKAMQALERGELRLIEKDKESWVYHAWIADILLPLMVREEESKLPLIRICEDVCRLEGSIMRAGAHVAPGCLLKPSFVDMAAYVDQGSIIDAWATVGAGAYIGKNCHIAEAVVIGGMLQPREDRPVVIEDDCFIGARSVITKGMHIESNCVIFPNTILNPSIKIFDTARGERQMLNKGIIPSGSVVAPSMYQGNSGFLRPCVEIIQKLDKVLSKESLRKLVEHNS